MALQRIVWYRRTDSVYVCVYACAKGGVKAPEPFVSNTNQRLNWWLEIGWKKHSASVPLHHWWGHHSTASGGGWWGGGEGQGRSTGVKPLLCLVKLFSCRFTVEWAHRRHKILWLHKPNRRYRTSNEVISAGLITTWFSRTQSTIMTLAPVIMFLNLWQPYWSIKLTTFMESFGRKSTCTPIFFSHWTTHDRNIFRAALC